MVPMQEQEEVAMLLVLVRIKVIQRQDAKVIRMAQPHGQSDAPIISLLLKETRHISSIFILITVTVTAVKVTPPLYLIEVTMKARVLSSVMMRAKMIKILMTSGSIF
jgi:hypothetical protein